MREHVGPGSGSTSAERGQGRPGERVLLLLLSIAAVALLLLSLDFRAGRDQAIFLEGGRVILEGGALYRDVWDIKPPGLFVLYALAIQMFGMSDLAPRLLELVFFGVTSACIIGLSKLVLDWRAGLFAIFLLAVGLTKSGFQYMAQAETLSFPFICLAVLLLSRAPAGRRAERWTWIVAGALYGCAFLLKPTLGVGALVGFLPVAVAGPALHLALLAGAMLFTVALQGKFIPYHFHAPLLPAAILGGWGFWLLWRRLAKGPVATTGFAALLALLLVAEQGTADIRRMVSDRVVAWQAPEPVDVRGSIRWDDSRNARAARWIDRTAPPDARTLFVWGFEPQIYLKSRLETANRYVMNSVLRMEAAPEAERERLMRTLSQAPPWAIIVQDDDVMLHVYGNRLTSRDILDEGFPELKTFIAQHYDQAKVLGGLTIHVRSGDGVGPDRDASSPQETRTGS